MSFFDEMADLADELLNNDFRVEAVLKRGSTSIDRATGLPTNTATDTPVIAVRGKRRLAVANGVFENQTIATMTRDVEPKVNDRLVIGGKTFTVTAVEETGPTGQPIVFVVVLK